MYIYNGQNCEALNLQMKQISSGNYYILSTAKEYLMCELMGNYFFVFFFLHRNAGELQF